MSKKLILGSGGIFWDNPADPILEHIYSLIDDKTAPRLVYLPTAGRDNPNDESEVNDWAFRHGFVEVTHLYLSQVPYSHAFLEKTILGASMIYCCGGNLKFLLHHWRRTGVDKLLRMAYDNGVVVGGQSSGAMCFCAHGYDNCGPGGAYMFLDTLSFVPYILCPHFEDWPEFLEDVKKQEYDAIGLDNDIIFSIVDGHFTIVDSHRNPRHTAYWMPADEIFKPHNLYREPQYLDAMTFEV